jgi:hypothetical protein
VINGAALSWRKLYRLTDNLLLCLFHAPVVGLMKLLRTTLPLGLMPRQISFEPAIALHPDLAAQARKLLDEFAALGLPHLTDLHIPELGGGTSMHVMTDLECRAYANVGYMAAGRRIWPEAFTPFADGGSVTTVTRKAAQGIDADPGKSARSVGPVPLAELWEHHLRCVQERAPQHGDIAPVTEEELRRHLRDDLRRFVDYQVARGGAWWQSNRA